MENKYEVISVKRLNDNINLFNINDLETYEKHSCLIIMNQNKKAEVLTDDTANKFDVGEALFQYDLDLLPFLPLNMISIDMYREYQDYYPGKGKCSFNLQEDYIDAYIKEEERIGKIKETNKLLIK